MYISILNIFVNPLHSFNHYNRSKKKCHKLEIRWNVHFKRDDRKSQAHGIKEIYSPLNQRLIILYHFFCPYWNPNTQNHQNTSSELFPNKWIVYDTTFYGRTCRQMYGCWMFICMQNESSTPGVSCKSDARHVQIGETSCDEFRWAAIIILQEIEQFRKH